MKQPKLSEIANNSWDAFEDIDSLIAKEDMPQVRMETPQAPATRQQQTTTVTETQPAQTQRVPQVNPVERAWNNVLDTSLNPYENSANQKVAPIGADLDNYDEEIRKQQAQQARQGQQPAQQQTQQPDNDPYIAAFELLQDFDFLRLPENVDLSKLDAAALQYFKQETLQEQRDEALEYVREQVAHDPYMLQLFDYAYYGREFADLPKMLDHLQEEHDYASFDITDEDSQIYIVNLYLREGLNPQDPRDAKMINLIPMQIDQMKEGLKLKKEAQIAKQHFINQATEKSKQEQARVLNLLKQQELAKQKEAYEAQLWNDAFKDTLARRTWSEGKKQAVAKEASLVQLKDGSRVPLWQLKQEVILNDPALFQMFLDFTSTFDLKNNTFIERQEEEISQNALNRMVQNLQNKSKNNNASSTNQSFDRAQQKPVNRVYNPKEEWG